MILKVDNLSIKPLAFKDLPFLKEIRDYSLEHLETQISYTLQQTQEWFNSNSPDWYSIFLGTEYIGYIRTSDSNKISNSIYIGMDLHPTHRGNGFAEKVYKEFIEWLASCGYLHILLRVQVRNYRAYNLYRKLGFSPVGILQDFVTTNQGTLLDVILMQKKI